MGTIRGRAVVDFLRHRLNLAPTATYDTRDFWDRSYAKAVRAHEWGVASGALLDYPFRDASPHRAASGGAGAAALADDCPRDGPLLVLGGGTSALGGDLADAGWADVSAVDFSSVAVDRGQREEPAVDWRFGDARDLSEYENAAFRSVVDKGTVDAIYLSAGPGHAADVRSVAAAAARVLEPRSGVFAVLSFSAPAYLWPLLADDAHWDVAASEVRRLDSIFLYLLRRRRAEGGSKRRRR